MTDLRQTSLYAKYMDSLGWKVEKIEGIYCYIKSLPLFGKFVKIQRPKKITGLFLKKVESLSPTKVLVEPALNTSYKNSLVSLSKFKYKENHSPYLPSKTIEIDLKKSKKILLSAMKAKTRYNIKIAQRNGIVIKASTDIVLFSEFWSKNVEGRSFMFGSQKQNIIKMSQAFGKNADLLIAYKDNEMIAGIFMPQENKIAYYMYAAASKNGKNLHAPTLVTWEAIKLAKKRGCKVFDFEGIYDERFPLKSWLGFSKFKKTFGGKELEYPASFTKNMLRIRIAK